MAYVPPGRRRELEAAMKRLAVEERGDQKTAPAAAPAATPAAHSTPSEPPPPAPEPIGEPASPSQQPAINLEKQEEEELFEQESSRNNAIHRYFFERSPVYRTFVEFSELVRNDHSIDHVFEAERPQGATTKGPSQLDLDAEFQLQKFEQFTKLIAEVDRTTRFTEVLRAGRGRRFLDICCAPGGFSRYICGRCPEAEGVGLALPVAKGGFAVLFRPKRGFVALDADVLNVQEPGAGQRWGHELTRFYGAAPFDLTIADGQFMQKNEGITRVRGWRLLLLAQFCVAVDNLADGGTLLFRSRHSSSRLHASCLSLFSTAFRDIRFAKPHFATHKSFVYIACVGFDAGRRPDVLATLVAACRKLRAGEMVEVLRGEEEEALAREMAPPLLAEFEPMWAMQHEALARWYRRQKARIEPGARVEVPAMPPPAAGGPPEAAGERAEEGPHEAAAAGSGDWRKDPRFGAAGGSRACKS